MKVQDIISEGMEFHASVIEPNKHGGHTVTPHGMHKEQIPCWVCEGKGTDRGYPCDYCNGDGKVEEWVVDSPELQVSNANGHAIITDILGKEFDYGGVVDKEELPALRRKLIKMLNVDKERQSMHKAPTDNDRDREMGVRGQEGNVTQIGRQGPRMMDMGRSDEQVLRYAQKLLDMVDYAMKNDLVISWA